MNIGKRVVWSSKIVQDVQDWGSRAAGFSKKTRGDAKGKHVEQQHWGCEPLPSQFPRRLISFEVD